MSEQATPGVPHFLGTDELIQMGLCSSRRTADAWAYTGTGPTFYKIGRHRRYRLEDVLAWLDQHRVDGNGGRAP